MHYGEQIKTVFEKEIAALENVKDTIDENIDDIISVLCNCKGKVVFSGIGKSGHISAKIASTFSSLGTPSIFMHPAEARHGDLGLLDSNDVVVLVSYSGESREITDLLPYIKLKSITTIAITGNNDSTLYREENVISHIAFRRYKKRRAMAWRLPPVQHPYLCLETR